MIEEDDAHDLLVKAYLDYFAANEKFEKGFLKILLD